MVLLLIKNCKIFHNFQNLGMPDWAIIKKDRFQMRNLSLGIGYFPWLREESFHAVWFIAVCIPFACFACPKISGYNSNIGIQIDYFSFISNFLGSFVSIFCFGIVIVRTPSLYWASASSTLIGWSKEIVLWYLPYRNSDVW